MKYSFISESKEKTKDLGKEISSLLCRGDVILLKGDLGAGKTTFVSGVAEGLNIKDRVLSPTFNIMKCYFNGTLPLYHIDAYRLENQNIELGLDEYIEGNGACFIEWPQYIAPLIPDETLSISIKNVGGDKREISLESPNAHYDKIVEKIKGEF